MQYVVAVLVGLVLAEGATLITTVDPVRVLSHKAIRLHPAVTISCASERGCSRASRPGNGSPSTASTPQLQRRRGDPHSPHIEGYWRTMLSHVYYYCCEAKNATPSRSTPPTSLTIASISCCSGVGPSAPARRVYPGPPMGFGPGLVALHARGRVPRAKRCDQRRGPHLRLQELSATTQRISGFSRTSPSGRACTTPSRPPGLAEALRFSRRVYPRGP